MAFSSDIPLTANQSSVSLEIPPVQNPFFQDTLSLFLKRVSDSINTKEGAQYNLIEQATFQQWYPTSISSFSSQSLIFRPGYRKVITFGAIAPAGILTTPHGITGLVQITDYRAIVNTAMPDFRVVPYVPTGTEYIAMRVTSTDFIIANGPTSPAILNGFAVLEYLKTT